MTLETLRTLTTGDWVKNIKTNEVFMITIFAQSSLFKTIEDLKPSLEDWVLEKSRLVVTDEERRRIKEYHEKLKEMTVR